MTFGASCPPKCSWQVDTKDLPRMRGGPGGPPGALLVLVLCCAVSTKFCQRLAMGPFAEMGSRPGCTRAPSHQLAVPLSAGASFPIPDKLRGKPGSEFFIGDH